MSNQRSFLSSNRAMARNPARRAAAVDNSSRMVYNIWARDSYAICAVQASIRVSELWNLHGCSAMLEVRQPRNICPASMRNQKYTMEVMERV